MPPENGQFDMDLMIGFELLYVDTKVNMSCRPTGNVLNGKHTAEWQI